MRNTIVIYYSKGGTAQQTALKIKNINPSDIDVVDILKQPNVDVSNYKNVYIGSGVYGFSIPMEIAKFVKGNSTKLKGKNLYLYMHALGSDDKYLNIANKAFGSNLELFKNQIFYLGGQAEVAKQNGFIKFMLGIIIKKKQLDSQKPNNIDKIQMNKLLATVNKR